MRSLALTREFTHRHRWGFAALVGYLFLVIATDLLVVPGSRAAGVDASTDWMLSEPRFITTVFLPTSFLVYYFLAAFSFGFSGDFASRESLYPARLFTRPVTTTALAGWPMLLGVATVMGLVFAVTHFVIRPSGGSLPLLWPPLFVALMLAWMQVLMWMPYGLRGMRVLVAVLWLVTLDAVVLIAVERQVDEWVMVAGLAPQLPLALLAARWAVARARRGEVPDWSGPFVRLKQRAWGRPQARRPFASAGRAQRWLEWRQNGVSLPVWVALLLPAELLLLFIARTDNVPLAMYTLSGALLTPPFMAAFTAPRMRRPSADGDGTGLPAFVMARPLTSVELIAAKLSTAVRSTLTAWLVVLVLVPTGLTLSGSWPVVTDRARELSAFAGAPRAVVLALLVLAGLVAWTWKQLVQSLYVGLSGRAWMLKASTCVTLALLLCLEPFIHWLRESAALRVALWNGLPWILGSLVAVKLSVAAWIATQLDGDRLLSDRALIAGASGWLVTVFALYGVLSWLVGAPLVPQYFLVLLATLVVPLARVAAAPLALARNRHG